MQNLGGKFVFLKLKMDLLETKCGEPWLITIIWHTFVETDF